MGRQNINFKLLSLNARGIRSFDRRKSVFNWLFKSSADICFLQETYSTPEVDNEWKKQWKGKTFFSHGTNHSRGVLILVKDQLDFRLQSLKVDSQGRYVLLEALIQDSPFALLNIYAPNKCAEQCDFFNKISEELKSSLTLADSSCVIGGDFNVIFDQDLDGSGGIKKTKESVKILEDICLEQDLIDIWRVRNPTEKRFTWRQKTPIIQRRLDYWLVNDSLQDDIVSVDIIPSIKSDHSAITLSINGIDDSKRGPSFWKFNCSLVNDNNYCDLLDTNIKSWLEEFKNVVDKRVLCAILKTGIIVVSVDEHCSEETDLIWTFVVAPSHVLVNSTGIAMLHFKFLLSLRYFFASTDIHICSAVLSITHVSILHLFFVVIIYKFIEGHNISLPRCAPLLLGIISFSLISSVCN